MIRQAGAAALVACALLPAVLQAQRKPLRAARTASSNSLVWREQPPAWRVSRPPLAVALRSGDRTMIVAVDTAASSALTFSGMAWPGPGLQADSLPRTPFMSMVGAGLLGGLVGVGAGLLVGRLVEDCDNSVGDDGCGWSMAFGALIFEPIGVSLGVHLKNGRKGNYVLDLLVSAATLVATPIAQIPMTALVERATSRD